MECSAITLYVSHGQIAIFLSAIQNPFNDWTHRHVAQGFAWREGSVSFLTPEENGMHLIEIVISELLCAVSADAIRAVEVPFEIPADGAIEVASISDAVPLLLPEGKYLLRCEFLKPSIDECERARLIFVKDAAPHFAVVVADNALSVERELLTTATAATGADQ